MSQEIPMAALEAWRCPTCGDKAIQAISRDCDFALNQIHMICPGGHETAVPRVELLRHEPQDAPTPRPAPSKT